MKLYEFLQKIEDCGQAFSINLSRHRYIMRPQNMESELNVEINIEDYRLSKKYPDINHLNKERKFNFTQDFTEEWKEIEIFIKKSLAKVAIDEE
jgi:hypothetical protein